MPWYGWVAIVMVLLFLLAGAAYRALRASRRGRRFLDLPASGRIRVGRVLLRDRAIGPLPKLVLVLLVAYLVMPFDLVPDFIPVLGQADDIAVIVGAVALLILLIPRERFEAALREAEQSAATSKSSLE